jgi:hypothetical protein
MYHAACIHPFLPKFIEPKEPKGDRISTSLLVFLLVTNIWHSSHGWIFVRSLHHRLPTKLHFTQRPHRKVDFGEDAEMADHFGKYPLQEVEEMRSGTVLESGWACLMCCIYDFSLFVLPAFSFCLYSCVFVWCYDAAVRTRINSNILQTRKQHFDLT